MAAIGFKELAKHHQIKFRKEVLGVVIMVMRPS